MAIAGTCLLGATVACSGAGRPTASEDEQVRNLHQVDAGTWRDVSWKLSIGTDASGGICQVLELDPPYYEIPGNTPPSVAPDVVARMPRTPNQFCGGAAGPGGRRFAIETQVADARGAPYHFVIVQASPAVSRVEITYDNGTREEATPTNGNVLRFFPTETRVTHVGAYAGPRSVADCPVPHKGSRSGGYIQCHHISLVRP
ncbi:MAG: hypothetical protein QOH74_1691 [Gaiellales bacterium]|nr:hypothetical protein [Gaiellales bacterium]